MGSQKVRHDWATEQQLFWKGPTGSCLVTSLLLSLCLFILLISISPSSSISHMDYYNSFLTYFPLCTLQFSSLQSLSRVWLFATPWIAACQASLFITNSQSSPKRTSIGLVMPSSHLILCRPLLLLPLSPPSIRVFSRVNSSHEVAKVLEFQL